MAFDRGKTTAKPSKRASTRALSDTKKRQVSFEKPIVGAAKPKRQSRRR